MGSIGTPQQKINFDHLIAVHYQVPNLVEAEKFMVDFGLQVLKREGNLVYFRGFGPDPYCYIAEKSPDNRKHFIGGVYLAQSEVDLKVAADVPGATPIEKCTRPGGGKQVVLTDPAGVKVFLVHGIEMRSQQSVDEETPADIVLNTSMKTPRKGTFNRFDAAPSKVSKCGHYGIAVDASNYDDTLAFYTSVFALAPSDIIHDKDGKAIMTFLHMDKGLEFVEHHTVFVFRSFRPLEQAHAHHCSFEVDNFDSQLVGHDWLGAQGWTNCYGVGRHKFGSHIFDYWFDASGNVVEHYTDGDMVNSETEVEYELINENSMRVWGPSATKAYYTLREEDAPGYKPREKQAVEVLG